MKKRLLIFNLILIFLVVFSFSACGGSTSENQKEKIMKEAVYSRISTNIYLDYKTVPSQVTYNFTKKDSDTKTEEYSVSGRVSVISGGVTYSGTYTATVTYNIVSNKATVSRVSVSKLYSK